MWYKNKNMLKYIYALINTLNTPKGMNKMISYYKTVNGKTTEISKCEKECWVNCISPTEEEIKKLEEAVNEIIARQLPITTEFITQDLEHWINDLSVEVVILALQKAVEKNAQYSYAKGIMKSWANKGIKTLEAAEVESLGNIRQKQNQWRQ